MAKVKLPPRSSTAPPRIQLRRKVAVVNKFETILFGKDVEVKRGCILPDDRIMLCGVGTYMYVCNPDGKRAVRILLQFVPFDVAVYDQTRAIVTGETGFQIINTDTNKPGQVFKPGGVCTAVACTKDNIVIANDYCKLTYLTIGGETIKTVSTSNTPYTLASNKDGCIFWTTWDNDEVHYIEPSGTERFYFSSPDLQDPVGISCDSKGNVFVMGQESNNVHKISNEGNTSKVVLKSTNGLKIPSGMAINPTKSEILVIDNRKAITIFRI